MLGGDYGEQQRTHRVVVGGGAHIADNGGTSGGTMTRRSMIAFVSISMGSGPFWLLHARRLVLYRTPPKNNNQGVCPELPITAARTA